MGTPRARVLERLTEVTPSGGGWMARCPAHQDKTPSLKIDERPDGAVLLHCHSGCSTAAVLKALGLRMSDLYATPPPPGWRRRT